MPRVGERILIDECLSPRLVIAAKLRGYDASHVTHLGKGAWQDYNLVPFIVQGAYLFVTQNGRDFRKLLGREEIHNGLVILVPRAERVDQIAMFNAALDFVESLDHTINRVIEVRSVDDIRLSNLPPPDEA